MSFSAYVKAHDKRCIVCRIFESDPATAAEIRDAWGSKNPPAPSVVAGYLSDEKGHAVTPINVRDHIRRLHDRKGAA